jgi:hypothetical protein
MKSRAALIACSITAIAAAACSTPEDGKIAALGPSGPVAGQAWEVGDAVLRTCGTLECHGTKLRNLRVYGYGSLREDPATLPGTGATTDKEYQLTYRAIVGLEPEIMSAVTQEKRGSSRLSLVRKGRGLDNHKGANRMPAGGPMERCLLSWLLSQTDSAACQEAAGYAVSSPAKADAGAAEDATADAGTR